MPGAGGGVVAPDAAACSINSESGTAESPDRSSTGRAETM
jgi:hypothetical protein